MAGRTQPGTSSDVSLARDGSLQWWVEMPGGGTDHWVSTLGRVIVDAKLPLGYEHSTNTAFGPDSLQRLRNVMDGDRIAPEYWPAARRTGDTSPLTPTEIRGLVWVAYQRGIAGPESVILPATITRAPRFSAFAAVTSAASRFEGHVAGAGPVTGGGGSGGPVDAVVNAGRDVVNTVTGGGSTGGAGAGGGSTGGGSTGGAGAGSGSTSSGSTGGGSGSGSGSAGGGTNTETGGTASTGGGSASTGDASGCSALMPVAFHLRTTATAATSGTEYPAGTRAVILERVPSITRGAREVFFKVRVGTTEGWAFVPTSAIPACAPGSGGTGTGDGAGDSSGTSWGTYAVAGALVVVIGLAVRAGIQALTPPPDRRDTRVREFPAVGLPLGPRAPSNVQIPESSSLYSLPTYAPPEGLVGAEESPRRTRASGSGAARL